MVLCTDLGRVGTSRFCWRSELTRLGIFVNYISQCGAFGDDGSSEVGGKFHWFELYVGAAAVVVGGGASNTAVGGAFHYEGCRCLSFY